MDLDPIITRLRAQLANVKSVGGAAELGAALDNTPAVPAVYVVPLAERALPPERLGPHQQQIDQTFGTLLVVANRRDATGAASLVDLKALRGQVRAALMGFVPVPAEGEPCAYVGGRLLKWDDGRLWWSDEWQVATLWRSA
ncbi:MAG: hypothetical protein RLY71_428 [Pseudomonadota bacterium]|jgi:hypothetical protein